jgi:membrane associated rhomboid family serine protease
MLIVPADPSYTRGRWALLTWTLVVVNTLVFVIAGGHDRTVQSQATDYYLQSKLGAYEYPAYLDTVKARGDERRLQLLQKLEALEQQAGETAVAESKPAAMIMLADEPFQDALDAGQVITPGSSAYSDWKALREPLQQIRARNWTRHAALRADAPRWWTLFTYQFLHGGWDHLIGNMVVLVLVGRLVECAVGSGRFILAYLVTGAAAGLFYTLVRHGSSASLVGASGAIAGVMGLFAVIFAGRRLRFFYSVIAFVGFATLPALWLLPYWIAWELLQLALSHGSHVAYEAHVGGLVSGALIGLLLRGLPGREQTEERLAAPEQDAAYEKSLREAGELLTRLRVDPARKLLESLNQQRPQDPRPLQKLYLLAKLAPDSPEYHATTARVLSADASAPGMLPLFEEVRADYLRSARPGPNLPGPLLVGLLEHCARHGDIAAADRILKPLIASGSTSLRARQALERLAKAATPEKARGYMALAARHFG